MITALVLSIVLSAAGEDLRVEQVLAPAVRLIAADGCFGSGTVIGSRPIGDGHEIRVLTAAHIVRQCPDDPVEVHVFMHGPCGETLGMERFSACVDQIDVEEDLAVLQGIFTRDLSCARVLPARYCLSVFQEVYVMGSLRTGPPRPTKGEISFIGPAIEGLLYIGASADIFFGNSGGALMVQVDGEWFLAGVTARVETRRGQVLTHLGYFVPPERIRPFLQRRCF